VTKPVLFFLYCLANHFAVIKGTFCSAVHPYITVTADFQPGFK